MGRKTTLIRWQSGQGMQNGDWVCLSVAHSVSFLSFAIVPLPERLEESHSPMLLYKDGSVAHIQLAPDERWRAQADLSRVDSTYVDALLAIEDERFYWHAGFDPFSIVRAMFQNLLSGEIVSEQVPSRCSSSVLWNQDHAPIALRL